ncbi:MAG TPA: type II secretion system major pseudopilin GspG [Nitrospirota bacterium]
MKNQRRSAVCRVYWEKRENRSIIPHSAFRIPNSKGFTLIEIMVVIIILGLLAGLVLPRFLGQEEKAKVEVAKTQIRSLEGALDAYKLDNGFYPSTDQGLDALIKKPETGRIPEKWREGGYLKPARIPKDPWGKDYVYLSPGSENREYEIVSYGADGEPGGEGNKADIESWKMQ